MLKYHYDFVFIKYFGLGLEGAALAAVLSNATGIGYILLVYSRSKDRTFRLTSPISEGIVKFIKRTFEICRTGLPATFGIICVAVKVWCIYKILGSTGGAGATQNLRGMYAVPFAPVNVRVRC